MPKKHQWQANNTGRPKGSLNKITGAAKDNIAAVFIRLGGTAAMAEWAESNKDEFYKIYARLIPTDVKLSGSIGSYTAIPTEQRDIDSVESAAGAAANGHSQQSH